MPNDYVMTALSDSREKNAYFHRREQIAKRLHHGLSETILVNTLIDVREFKKANSTSGRSFEDKIGDGARLCH